MSLLAWQFWGFCNGGEIGDTNNSIEVFLQVSGISSGKTYTIQHSPDLVNWTNYLSRVSTNNTNDLSIILTGSPPRAFFRVKYFKD
ncbi:MAG: hypothetical protein QW103_01425 [Candidatus Pacearchaeota archaeon]